MGFRTILGLSTLAMVLVACSDPPNPNDGGPDGPIEIEPPASPAPPTLPSLTPCQAGWTPREPAAPGSATICDPFPEGGPLWCPTVDEAHFPGEAGCVRLGSSCPDGDWDEVPDNGLVLFVRAGEPEGGDGTESSPFGTIAEAMDLAADGTVIALSKGIFDEEIELRQGVTLWGACVAETRLTTSSPDTDLGTVEVRGLDATLRNLQIGGPRVGVRVPGAVASVRLEDVVIDGATGYGVIVEGGVVAGLNVVIRDTQAFAGTGELGIGLWSGMGAQVDLSRVVIDGNRYLGVASFGASTSLKLSDLCILNTQAQEVDGSGGFGVMVGGGAGAELARVVIEENRDIGVWVYDADTEVLLSDAIVRETLSRESDGHFGLGMEVSRGAHVEVRRALFDQNRETGIWALDAGSRVELTDAIIRDTRERDQGGQFGQGLVVEDGARVDVSRTLLEGNSSSGASGIGNETRLVMTDLVVRITRGQDSDGRFGSGLLISEGARADVTRALFERNTTEGVRATRFGTILNLSDTVIRSTRSQQSDGLYGIGLVAGSEAQVDVLRAVIDGNRYAGIVAFGFGTNLSAEDLRVMSTTGQERDGYGGRGIEVSQRATVELSRAAFEQNQDVSVVTFGEDTSLILSDVVVQQTLARAGDGGIGVASLGGAELEARRLRVSENALCGIMLANGRDLETGLPYRFGGSMNAAEVEISGNPFGLNVQTDSVDVEQLRAQLLFVGNDVDVDTSQLIEPALGPPLGAE